MKPMHFTARSLCLLAFLSATALRAAEPANAKDLPKSFDATQERIHDLEEEQEILLDMISPESLLKFISDHAEELAGGQKEALIKLVNDAPRETKSGEELKAVYTKINALVDRHIDTACTEACRKTRDDCFAHCKDVSCIDRCQTRYVACVFKCHRRGEKK